MLVELTSARALDARAVGGKAAGLARLVQADTVVPRTLVVPVECFQQFFDHVDLKPLVTAISTANQEQREQLYKELRAKAARVPLPQNLLAAATEMLPGIGQSMVCRSSAVSEDQEQQSFAGQLSSYLGLAPTVADFARGVKAVWLSLLAPGVLSYVEAGTGRVADVVAAGCAVLIQELIDAERSGVLFLESGTVTIEAILGLGLPLVSGLAQPDVYVRSDSSWVKEIQEFKRAALVTSRTNWADLLTGDTLVGAPGRMAGRASLIQYEGGLSLIRPFHPLDSAPTLTDTECDFLRDTAERIGQWIGAIGCDLEWTWGPTGLVVLQARPITAHLAKVNGSTGAGLSQGDASGILWRPSPGALPPEEPFILLVPEITPDLVSHIARAEGVVAAMGGRLSHGAILCREMRKPLVVSGDWYRRLRPGKRVRIDGATGLVVSKAETGLNSSVVS